MRRTLREHRFPVLVIATMVALALVTTGYLLVHQRFPLPWSDVYDVELELGSAQAVVPGQGQMVSVSGVVVGEISGVRREAGRAILRLRLRRDELPVVHRDARATLRPRTGLQDMTVELDPGRPGAGRLPDGGRIPASQTTSQVQLDEVAATLDADTRAYLQLALRATGEALGPDRGRQLRRLLELGAPTARSTDRALAAIARQHARVRQLVTRMRRVSETLGRHDREVAATISAAADVFAAIDRRSDRLRGAVDELPATLVALRRSVGDTADLAEVLVPAAERTRPALRRLTAALPDANRLLADLPATLRPLAPAAAAAVPVAERVDVALTWLRPMLPQLRATLGVATSLANLVGYDPPGDERGFSFWLAWFAHNANSMLSTEDAHGAAWRGQLLITCGTLTGLDGVRQVEDLLETLGVCR
ncbi:MCE-family protein Mce6D [Patulibacter medicamentivorans]|uniref:MCE-family protein Mce6D n=1 Tax=Patulibacter medicamentivorans TaxID=1097667 RepID=H0E9N5_9ACTN|nr:MlaD family protein [Patulibacter medicamentivorans]EHN09611.1 MCE-family protein Mce6D [Patulibacter medicamentivorans]